MTAGEAGQVETLNNVLSETQTSSGSRVENTEPHKEVCDYHLTQNDQINSSLKVYKGQTWRV